MNKMTNPFTDSQGNVTDTDRHSIWEMLVNRDIHAFVAQDWSMVADDFVEPEFYGIHAHNSNNPDVLENWFSYFGIV